MANIEDPSALSHLIAGALRIKAEEKQAAARGGRRGQAPAPAVRDPGARARRHLARHEDPVAGRVRARQDAARVLPAPAAQGDPGRAGRGRRDAGGGQRAARAARRHRPARGGPPSGRPRAGAAREAAPGLGGARRDPHLAGVDRLAALGQGRPRTTSTSTRPGGPRRGPLRHRGGQGPHPRVPRRAQAQARRPRLASCASSGRPAWARRRSGARSPGRWGASSSASAWAAYATRPRSAATGAPTSARCPGRSSAPCATRSRTTRCS